MFARVLRRACNGDDVVDAHDQVGHDDGLDGGEQLVAALDVTVGLVVGCEQLDADPHQQNGTDQFDERHGQQRHRERDEDDAQDDGAEGAPDDAFGALCRWQLAARQRDHNRVVATQQNVDKDDLSQGDPERGR